MSQYLKELDAKWEQGLALDRIRQEEHNRKKRARAAAKGRRKAGKTGSVLLVFRGHFR